MNNETILVFLFSVHPYPYPAPQIQNECEVSSAYGEHYDESQKESR